MGNMIRIKTKGDNIEISALKLQQFFFENRFNDDGTRDELLSYIPVACNYWFWHPTEQPLSDHLKLRFCDGCNMIVTTEYYDRLREFSQINKDNSNRTGYCHECRNTIICPSCHSDSMYTVRLT